MTLIVLLLVFLLAGLGLWALWKFAPVDLALKLLPTAVVVLALLYVVARAAQ